MRIFSILLAALFFLTSIAGCGSNAQQGSQTPASNAPAQSTALPAATQPAAPPANTAQPAATAIPVVKLTGTGQKASEKFTLTQGVAIFTLKYTGTSYFSVELLDSTGDPIDLLANDTGSFSGSKLVSIKKAGEYLFDIEAQGPWEITIEQPKPSTAPATTSMIGKGQQASSFFSLKSGLATFRMTHKGTKYFSVELHDASSEPIDLLANENGSFEGSKAVRINKTGIYIMDIEADGDWTITIEQ